MKFRLLIALLPVFFVAGITGTQAQVEYGVFGGISVPNLSASGSENNPLNTGYSSRLGPDFGIISETHFTKLFSMESRIEYSAQGGKKDGMQAFPTPAIVAGYLQSRGMAAPTYLYANFKSEARLSYLRFPFLAKLGWNFGKMGHFRFSVGAGPFVGFLLSARQVVSGNSKAYFDPEGQQALPFGSQSFDSTNNIRDQLHKANFGVDGNIGLAYVFGNKLVNKIFLEAGGNYGFVNIQKGSENGKNNTGAATLLLGYTYRFNLEDFRKKMHK